MPAVRLDITVEGQRLKAGLDAWRADVRSFKRDVERDGAAIGQALAGGGGSGNRGLQFQNASYQLQDFLVQVQSGQGVLRAFVQQGTQLASGFGPWGAAIGLAVAALGGLWTALADTGEQSEETAKALEELARTMEAVNREMVSMYKDEAAEALADHKKAVDDVTNSWENATQAQAAHFDRLQSMANAAKDFALAGLAVEEQVALKGASEERAGAIRREFDERRRGIGLDFEIGGIDNEKARSEFNKNAAQRGIDEIMKLMPELQGQRADLLRERALMRPPGVLSNEQIMLRELEDATAREDAKRQAWESMPELRGVPIPSDYGDAKDKDTIERITKMLPSIEATMDARRESYNRDGLTNDQKYSVAQYDAEREVNAKAVATVEEELARASKQLAEAHKQLANETKNLTEIELKEKTAKAAAQAAKTAADNAAEKEERERRERLQEQMTDLRDAAEKGERRLMSPQQHAEALRKELGQAFGTAVNSADDVQGGLAKLKAAAEAARARGDLSGEKAALDKYREAQGLAGELAGLGKGSQRARVAGEVTSAVGFMLGSSGNNLVLDESKRQTQVLEQISSALQSIDRKSGGEGGYNGGLNDILSL